MTRVCKRRVFYISGFDPRGVAAYHRMFCEESQKQSAWSGKSVSVGRFEHCSPLASEWQVKRATNEGIVDTTFEFMKWDDIVRRYWRAGWVRLYRLTLNTYWHGIVTTGLLAKIFQIAKWPFLTGLVPALILFGVPLLALLAGIAGFAWGQGSTAHGDRILPVLCGTAGFTAVIALGLWLERKLRLGWLLRTYAFVMDYGQGNIPELEARLGEFAERIAGYMATTEDDEVLVVGHSVGANLAVSVLARMLQLTSDRRHTGKPVFLLTLGGTIPMQGLLPNAGMFREELALLAKSGMVTWVDVTDTQDAACFPMLNPVTASGVALDPEGCGPKVLSAGFKEMLTPKTYRTASWNLFRMHFQYLMASERECAYDYLSITTENLSFHTRFE